MTVRSHRPSAATHAGGTRRVRCDCAAVAGVPLLLPALLYLVADDAGAVRADALVQPAQLDPDLARARSRVDRPRQLPLRDRRRIRSSATRDREHA